MLMYFVLCYPLNLDLYFKDQTVLTVHTQFLVLELVLELGQLNTATAVIVSRYRIGLKISSPSYKD